MIDRNSKLHSLARYSGIRNAVIVDETGPLSSGPTHSTGDEQGERRRVDAEADADANASETVALAAAAPKLVTPTYSIQCTIGENLNTMHGSKRLWGITEICLNMMLIGEHGVVRTKYAIT